jgi:hypothetical protein
MVNIGPNVLLFNLWVSIWWVNHLIVTRNNTNMSGTVVKKDKISRLFVWIVNAIALRVYILCWSSSSDGLSCSLIYSILCQTWAIETISVSPLSNSIWRTICSSTTLWIWNSNLRTSRIHYFISASIHMICWKCIKKKALFIWNAKSFNESQIFFTWFYLSLWRS